MKRFLAILAATLVLVPSATMPAAVEAAVIPMTLQDLVDGADVCLKGNVVAATAAWTPDHRMIYTTYRIQSTEVLMGTCGAYLDVRVQGGDLGGLRIRNSEAPSYALGEEVVVFAKAAPDGVFETYGWFQGKYTVLGGMVREMVASGYPDLRADILAAVAAK